MTVSIHDSMTNVWLDRHQIAIKCFVWSNQENILTHAMAMVIRWSAIEWCYKSKVITKLMSNATSLMQHQQHLVVSISIGLQSALMNLKYFTDSVAPTVEWIKKCIGNISIKLFLLDNNENITPSTRHHTPPHHIYPLWLRLPLLHTVVSAQKMTKDTHWNTPTKI